jgi:hypothetical protein
MLPGRRTHRHGGDAATGPSANSRPTKKWVTYLISNTYRHTNNVIVQLVVPFRDNKTDLV